MGDHDPATGNYRPVAVMSDGDVSFMTQLSSDIVRSVNRITSVRQHGTRMHARKRRIKHGRPSGEASPPQVTVISPARRSRTSRENTPLSGSKRTRVRVVLDFGTSSIQGHCITLTDVRDLQKSTDIGDQLQQCYKCGRKETPEWRKGPKGLLCNSCGLVYMKQKRKQKASEKEHSK